MPSTVNSSLSVSFVSGSSVFDSKSRITVKLDSEKNVDEDGNPIYEFPIENGTAYIAVYSKHSYKLVSSAGDLVSDRENVPRDVEDIIVFPNESKAFLSHIPTGTVNYSWVGKKPSVTVSFDEELVTLSKKVVGVLRCNYTALADIWKLNYSRAAEEGEKDIVVVVAIDTQGSKSSVNVNFVKEKIEPGEGGIVSYQVRVLDFCTDEPLGDVDVWIDNKYKGKTDSEGLITIDNLIRGEEYALKTMKTGYTSSDLDTLKNDWFTVP